jgi:hypothetical protein
MNEHEYRQRAAQCLRLAEQVGHQSVKLTLITMAQSWWRLARQAEKTGRWRWSTRHRASPCMNPLGHAPVLGLDLPTRLLFGRVVI